MLAGVLGLALVQVSLAADPGGNTSWNGPGGGVAHWAHLGGLVVGYLYLKMLRSRLRPMDELKYRYLRWKMGRARSRFDVYSGGRSTDDDWKSDWKKHIH